MQIAEFSPAPAGRHRTDGPFSGEAFREDWLVPALKSHATVTLDLDDVEGYGSSFLEEAFGGLIREHGLTLVELRTRLKLESEDPSVIEEIWDYIADAA